MALRKNLILAVAAAGVALSASAYAADATDPGNTTAPTKTATKHVHKHAKKAVKKDDSTTTAK